MRNPGIDINQKTILVSEIFGPTIQGEGSEIGKQTVFVRFAGCDYRCKKCDSLFAVLPELINKNARRMTQNEIYGEVIEILNNHQRSHVTFSGGNPAMWPLDHLVNHLAAAGVRIGVETQGTIFNEWLNNDNVDVTVSPKGPGMGEKHDPKVFSNFIHSLVRKPTLKVVVFDQRDIEFLVDILHDNPQLREKCYISVGNATPPEPAERLMDQFSPDDILESMRHIVEDVVKDPRLYGVKILPQLHTLLWGNQRGV